jgi:hypothetical protein
MNTAALSTASWMAERMPGWRWWEMPHLIEICTVPDTAVLVALMPSFVGDGQTGSGARNALPKFVDCSVADIRCRAPSVTVSPNRSKEQRYPKRQLQARPDRQWEFGARVITDQSPVDEGTLRPRPAHLDSYSINSGLKNIGVSFSS